MILRRDVKKLIPSQLFLQSGNLVDCVVAVINIKGFLLSYQSLQELIKVSSYIAKLIESYTTRLRSAVASTPLL